MKEFCYQVAPCTEVRKGTDVALAIGGKVRAVYPKSREGEVVGLEEGEVVKYPDWVTVRWDRTNDS